MIAQPALFVVEATPRQRAVAWARRTALDPAAVVLDTETTGLGPDAEIVDLAVVRMDGRVVLDALCCPLRRIPPEATAVHGISERTVHKAEMWRELYPRVARALRDKTVVIWNGAFDTQMLRQVSAAHGLADPVERWHCAMMRFGEWDGTPSAHGDGPKWWKLADACERFGIAPGSHRALADAEACRRVVLAMAGMETEG